MAEHQGAGGAELSEASLGLGRRVARMVIQRIVVPLIVTGLVGLDEAIELIKRGVVAALADTGEANGFLAGHVSKSRSWFQEYLRRAREEERRSVTLVEPGSSTDGGEESSDAYNFMLSVMSQLLQVYPEAVSLSRLRELVDVPEWRMDDAELSRCLGFFEKLGTVKIVVYDREGPRVRAAERFTSAGVRPGQIQRVSERLGWVAPLALAYCQGKGDFGGFVGELSPRALERARGRLRDAAADVLAEAIADTQRSDDPANSNVPVRIIIAIGETGGFDEQR